MKPSDIDRTSNAIFSLLSATSRPRSSTKYRAVALRSGVGQTNVTMANVQRVGSSISTARMNAAMIASRVAVTLTR